MNKKKGENETSTGDKRNEGGIDFMKKEHAKKQQTAKTTTDDASVTIHAPKGIVRFLLDHAKYIEGTEGYGSVQEYFEEAIWKDFQAQVDVMHLKIGDICTEYEIPQAPFGKEVNP